MGKVFRYYGILFRSNEMDHSNKTKGTEHNIADTQAKIKDSATDLLNEGKKLAGDIYHQSKDRIGDKVSDVEDSVQEYSDKLIKKIHDNPLSSVLIAAGIGMLFATIFRKK